MDRVLNPRLEKETIYEIYRGCRLCGAGAGYKMPIIQNVVDLEDSGLNLSQKIRETIQIEVHQDDKMPPLICELCVDKVNDFYEFLSLCHRTNKMTRMKLGLPLQNTTKAAANQPETNDCILGDTAPIYINDDSDDETLVKLKTKPKNKQRVSKVKESEVRIKIENYSKEIKLTRSSRFKRSPTPVRVTRLSNSTHNKDVSLSKLQEPTRRSRPDPVLIKKEKTPDVIKTEDENSLLMPRLKRTRERDVKIEVPAKIAKLPMESPKSSHKTSPKNLKPAPKSSKPPAKLSTPPSKAVKRPASPPKRTASPARSTKRTLSPKPAREADSPTFQYTCTICRTTLKNVKSYSSHMRLHSVTFTKNNLACNACGEWFNNIDEVTSHHFRHKHMSLPYNCRRCTADFMDQQAYESHFDNKQCIPWDHVPDVRCKECWRFFATDNLLIEHKCAGEDGRPGGKCIHCNRTYVLLKNLKKHEVTCMHKKKSNLVVDPEIMARLKPIQVRVARCDALLRNMKQGHYDVSTVTDDFGLDNNSVYPYKSSVRSVQIKKEPCLIEYDTMVTIKEEIKQELCSEIHYDHWDSNSSENVPKDDNSLVLNTIANVKKVEKLGTLTLKTLFSQKCLGKVPKRHKNIENETFDSTLNDSEFDIRKDIDNIISNLDSDMDKSVNVRDEDSDISRVNEGSQSVEVKGGFGNDLNVGGSDADSYSLLDETQSYTEEKSEKQYKNDHKDNEETTSHHFVHSNDKINENSVKDDNNGQCTNSNVNFDKLIHNDEEKFNIIDEETNSLKDIEAFTDTGHNETVGSGNSDRTATIDTHKHNGTLKLDEENDIKNINVSKSKKDRESVLDDYTGIKEIENNDSSQDTQMSDEQSQSEAKNISIDNNEPNKQHDVVHNINDSISKGNNINRASSPPILNNLQIDSNIDSVKEKTEINELNKHDTVSSNKVINSENVFSELGSVSDGLKDISDGEMDDITLMKELDAQIGETDDRNTSSNGNNLSSNEGCNVSGHSNVSDGVNRNFYVNGEAFEGSNEELNEIHKTLNKSLERNNEHDDTNKDLINKIDDKSENNISNDETSSNIDEKPEKDALEDPLRSGDNGSKSTDLDSISNNEFNFDI